jgi:hypothetical protein
MISTLYAICDNYKCNILFTDHIRDFVLPKGQQAVCPICMGHFNTSEAFCRHPCVTGGQYPTIHVGMYAPGCPTASPVAMLEATLDDTMAATLAATLDTTLDTPAVVVEDNCMSVTPIIEFQSPSAKTGM